MEESRDGLVVLLPILPMLGDDLDDQLFSVSIDDLLEEQLSLGDLEDQPFSISVERLLDGQLSLLSGVPLAVLFDSWVEGGCEAGGVVYIL